VELIARRGERTEKVSVTRDGDGLRVTVGDAAYAVDAAASGGLHSLRIDGAHYEVAVQPLGDGSYRVSGRRGADDVEVLDPLAHLARQSGAAAGARGKERVTAQMPGRVVALLAAAGDEVKAGQGVVVLEAMKMENEILADRDGVLRKLFVAEGQPVESGEALFELE
jgi:acetyl/propionyl-CoA carboxylase alpha subunit